MTFEEQVRQIIGKLILSKLKQKPYAMSLEEIADEVKLPEWQVKAAMKELDEVRCVAGDLYEVLG